MTKNQGSEGVAASATNDANAVYIVDPCIVSFSGRELLARTLDAAPANECAVRGCAHHHAVTPRPGIEDGHYCARTQQRANYGRCWHRHVAEAR